MLKIEIEVIVEETKSGEKKIGRKEEKRVDKGDLGERERYTQKLNLSH